MRRPIYEFGIFGRSWPGTRGVKREIIIRTITHDRTADERDDTQGGTRRHSASPWPAADIYSPCHIYRPTRQLIGHEVDITCPSPGPQLHRLFIFALTLN